MSSATSSLFNLSPMTINSSLSSQPNLFITKASYPFLSLPLKPIQLIHISSFSPKNKLSSSFSSVVPFVAQTSDWAQQDNEVIGEAEEGESVEESSAEDESGAEDSFQDNEVVGEAEEGEFVEESSAEEESGAEDSFQEPSEDAKLFVGNLPYDMTSEQLAQLFEQAGVVNISDVIYNRDTDQSRGFAFVTMDTVEEAEKAVQMFNGYDINGRLLTVNKAAPRGSRPERPARSFESSFRLYVGNLPWKVDNSGLEQIFSAHGNVVDARVLYDRESGRSRGFGFVTMSSQTEVDNAISALDGQSVEGRNIKVNVAEERPRGNSF